MVYERAVRVLTQIQFGSFGTSFDAALLGKVVADVCEAVDAVPD
ncbi:MAG: hypothetical protein ABIO83_03045 [Ilumatobacteraceae bacterium]